MNNKTYIPVTVGLLLLSAVAFNNCSKVDFSAEKPVEIVAGDVGNPPGVVPTPQPPPPPQEAIKNCQTAAEKNQLLKIERDVKFGNPKTEAKNPKNVCEFGVGDNMSALNEYVRARYEQEVTLTLPPGAVICDAEIVSPVQPFAFDDMFYLTFNDQVLASSLKRSLVDIIPQPVKIESSGKMIGLYQYDWMKIRGKDFKGVNNQSNDYCLGKDEGHASCSWPLSEKAGQIKLDFDPEILINIGLMAKGGEQKFKFVTTGDNDLAIDCQHDPLELKATVYYYVQ